MCKGWSMLFVCVCAHLRLGDECSSVFEKHDRFGVRAVLKWRCWLLAFVLRDNRQHSPLNGRFRGGKRGDPFTCPYARSCGDCHTAAKKGDATNCAFSHQRRPAKHMEEERKCVLSTGLKCALQVVGSHAQRLLWFMCSLPLLTAREHRGLVWEHRGLVSRPYRDSRTSCVCSQQQRRRTVRVWAA